ncbi:MAG: methyltransferase domain-containing protein [Alphaproteobacteria bacterium]|nr:methyltransferase domain-containing protein [Alphaproteobacteria bacterium]
MNPYRRYIEPALVECACGLKPISRQRQKIVPRATGVVLEIGFGAGQNLPFYDASKVDKLFALEPSELMRRRASRRLAASPLSIEFLDLPSEEIPLPDGSIDAVLVTYTLCTIPDALTALAGMRRVLRRGGVLHFCEHGAAPDRDVRKWQDRFNGIWGAIAGGCNLNRNVPELLRAGGFDVQDLKTMYLPSTPKALGFNYWGSATARP